MDFPLIYCNGDSYSNENYRPILNGKVYANSVAEHYRGFVINKAISGCSNRRIIRTSVHDLIQQRQLNPTQEIIALIGLTFDLRSEIWIQGVENKFGPEESDFKIQLNTLIESLLTLLNQAITAQKEVVET